MSEEKLKIYQEKFAPEYSSGNWNKAEEIARVSDLGSVLRKSEYNKMLKISGYIGMKGANDSMDLFKAGKKEEAIKIIEENLERNKYWIKVSEGRK